MHTIATILLNYALVQTAITIFIGIFYLLYRRAQTTHHQDINQEIRSFFESKHANYLVFFWAFGEALAWFVIPEFLLLLMIFMRVKRNRQLLYYDIYGTIAGTCLALVLHFPERIILKIPYIQPAMIDQVNSWYQHHGVFGLLFQPFSGVPYKVFANLAPDYHFFIPLFLFLAVMVRVSRYFIIFAILSSIQPAIHKFVYKNYIRLFLIATFIFAGLLLRVYLNYGPSYIVK